LNYDETQACIKLLVMVYTVTLLIERSRLRERLLKTSSLFSDNNKHRPMHSLPLQARSQGGGGRHHQWFVPHLQTLGPISIIDSINYSYL